MCGRYASTRTATELSALFEVEDLTEGDLVPAYNIAPTDPAPIVRLAAATPVLCVARWGFLPSWARDAREAARMINARAETVASSRAFGAAFAQRRCLVPADGWYEWRRVETAGRPAKRPFFMTRPERVVFGGIWSFWGTGETSRLTFSIITVPAVGVLADVHARMPLVLDASQWEAWLRGSDPATLLTPPTSEYCAGFEVRPVSTAVGDVRKDGPELVRPVASLDSIESTMDIAPTLF